MTSKQEWADWWEMNIDPVCLLTPKKRRYALATTFEKIDRVKDKKHVFAARAWVRDQFRLAQSGASGEDCGGLFLHKLENSRPPAPSDLVHSTTEFNESEYGREALARFDAKMDHEGGQPSAQYCKHLFTRHGPVEGRRLWDGHLEAFHYPGAPTCHRCFRLREATKRKPKDDGREQEGREAEGETGTEAQDGAETEHGARPDGRGGEAEDQAQSLQRTDQAPYGEAGGDGGGGACP